VIRLSPSAERQVLALLRHYSEQGRPEAARNVLTAIDWAIVQIERNPMGVAAPRPYPELARPGRAWTKAGRYWIAYSAATPPVILADFLETANIPRRL
jgi:plasmid stabilization system protein ParE